MKIYYNTRLSISLLTVILFLKTIGFAQTNPVPQVIPFTQDFSTLLHTSTAYPAGLQGWKVSSAATTSVVTTGPTADHTLTANSSASSNAGGIHNYNGKIGLLSSGSTNPGIAMAINTSGSNNITLSYSIMVIRNPYDGGSNTRINESVLQYRIGNTGAFTTLAGVEYVSGTIIQTTSGVTTPQNLENRSIVLPASCNNQPEVQIRWINHDQTGAGSRPSFAVDNIVVEQDNDGDGFGAITDCNDNDVTINSAATEICDGVDNNCDGNIDDVVLNAPTISPSGIINLCKPDAVNLSIEGSYDSYQWYKNGTIISGATSNNYNTNKPGYYSVTVMLGDCSATSAVQSVAVLASPLANISAPNGLDLCFGVVKLKASYNATYTYQWYLEGSPIAATSYTYLPLETGNYYCEVTSAEGCSRNTTTLTVINSCGRIGETKNTLNVYPNPSNGEFNILFSADQSINTDADIRIYNLLGAQVYQNSTSIINGMAEYNIQLNELSGMYFIKIAVNEVEYNSTVILD